MRYRRTQTPGGTCFFTVVTYQRHKFLCAQHNVELLRTAFRTVKSAHPFIIDVFVSALYLDIAIRRQRFRRDAGSSRPTVVADPDGRAAQIYKAIARKTGAEGQGLQPPLSYYCRAEYLIVSVTKPLPCV